MKPKFEFFKSIWYNYIIRNGKFLKMEGLNVRSSKRKEFKNIYWTL